MTQSQRALERLPPECHFGPQREKLRSAVFTGMLGT